MKLWHCKDSRSLRPLWALEEMGLTYELEVLPFPPRFLKKEFLDENVLGTVPFFSDAGTTMTESSAICHYLAQRYQKTHFTVDVSHCEYGDYLNWLYHSDATLTFPQTLFLRYEKMEPEERKQPQVASDYRKWFHARLRRLDKHMESREFLNDDRFTIADIAVGYALYLGELNGFSIDYSPQVQRYLRRLKRRPAFVRANEIV
ncbi:glutathione S-transferase family protein [Arenicella sp. 4NH20-0111]|uniref:glutathione S-transferase family protein n=1 Tax=Arenicella sp. 4NH20-0111 TaxID=3127648 RepID=UPI0033405F61